MSDILAIMQNQWVRDPETLRRILEKRPNMRRDLVRRLLFAGCLTGRRIKSVFGNQLVARMVFEEASPQIGGKSSAVFPADLDHLREVIVQVNPHTIIAFGKVAAGGLHELGQNFIEAPHPAARGPETIGKLGLARSQLEKALLLPSMQRIPA